MEMYYICNKSEIGSRHCKTDSSLTMNYFISFKLQIISAVVYFCIAFSIVLARESGKRKGGVNLLIYLAIFCLLRGMAIYTEHFLTFHFSAQEIKSQVSLYLAAINLLAALSLILGVARFWEYEFKRYQNYKYQILSAILFIFTMVFFVFIENINTQHLIIYFLMVLFSLSVWIYIERHRLDVHQIWYRRYALPLSVLACSVTQLLSPYTLTETLYLLGSAILLLLVVIQNLRTQEQNRRQAELDSFSSQLHEAHLQELGKWSAALAHEVKTPLSSALLATDMMVRLTQNDEALLCHTTRLRTSIQRVIAICQSVLSYSRNDALDKSEVLIAESLQEVLTLLDFRLRHFVVTCHVEEGLSVVADRNLLLSVWSNLITNAIDACEDSSSKHIVIEAYFALGKVHITIHDEGVGIATGQTAVVQDAFVTTKSKQGGTGVGLHLVATILKAHQGSLSFDDTQSGCCAHVVLPGRAR